jgi:hypothetical protein
MNSAGLARFSLRLSSTSCGSRGNGDAWGSDRVLDGADQPKLEASVGAQPAGALTENPYRAVLVAARAEVLLIADAARVLLNRPRRTLALSWRCPAADGFAAGLDSVERPVMLALQECLAELDALIRAQPELILPDAWQVGWRSAVESGTNPMRTWR